MKLELLTWLNASRSRQRSSIGRRNRAVRLSRLMVRYSVKGGAPGAAGSRRRPAPGGLRVQAQGAGEEAAGMRCGKPRDLLRRALADDRATAMAALRAEVHHPVGGLDHVQVVLDHHHGVAVVAQLV